MKGDFNSLIRDKLTSNKSKVNNDTENEKVTSEINVGEKVFEICKRMFVNAGSRQPKALFWLIIEICNCETDLMSISPKFVSYLVID